MNIILIKIAECCWSISGSENISEARHLHGIDMEYTPYPRQYLMDFADLEFFFKKDLMPRREFTTVMHILLSMAYNMR